MTAIFAGACALLLRFQVELLQSIGFPKGFFGLIDLAPLLRGQIVYSLFIVLLMVLAWFSKGVDKNVYIAASITMMLSAFCVSTLVMVL